jgi:hypothetical protein
MEKKYYEEEMREREEKERLRKDKIALTDRFLVLNQNELPEDKIPVLRTNMLHCSLRKLQALQELNLRSVYSMQFVSIILGWSGIDRMLLGDFGLGIFKLFTLGGFGFLMLYDWVTVVHRTRYHNYLEVMSVLDYDDYEAPEQS